MISLGMGWKFASLQLSVSLDGVPKIQFAFSVMLLDNTEFVPLRQIKRSLVTSQHFISNKKGRMEWENRKYDKYIDPYTFEIL